MFLAVVERLFRDLVMGLFWISLGRFILWAFGLTRCTGAVELFVVLG